jgi:benzoylformate decarboxylase
MELLRALGMTTVFGNPGSTELRFLRDWPEDFRYIMGLHEGCAIAMADAYAQKTGNAALVSLHSAGGVGNAMGTIYTAMRNNAPLVIMAGQQTRAMLPTEPFLYSQDAPTLPRPYVKWSLEPARAEDVPAAIARAVYFALERPYGPTFVSVPEDDWDRETALLGVRHIHSEFVANDAALDAVAAALNGARSPALVAGAGVDRDAAAELAVALAERCGARVFASAMASRCGFPEAHPLFAGALPRIRSGVVEKLAEHDVVIALGAPVFNYHIHAEGPYLPEGTTLFQLADDPSLLSWAPVGTGVVTTLRPALERLLERVAARATRAPAPRTREAVAPSDPITVEYLLQTLAQTLPEDALVAEEAPATHTVLHDWLPMRPGAFFTMASGSLGFGLPAAVGVALAAPGKRVLALIGDGSAQYAPQGLWNAVEHNLPIAFVIVNNTGYSAMRSFSRLYGTGRSISFDIGHVDFCALAKSYGCPGVRVERAADLAAALRDAHRSNGPILVDVAVESGEKKLF